MHKLTILGVAQKIRKNMMVRERQNGERFYCLNKDIDWQIDIIHTAHLGRGMSDDIYDRIDTFINIFCHDLDEDSDEDDALRIVESIESDVYTEHLIQWLSQHIDNVEYLDQAMGFSNTGIDLLMQAQSIYIHEIGSTLVKKIVKYIDSN